MPAQKCIAVLKQCTISFVKSPIRERRLRLGKRETAAIWQPTLLSTILGQGTAGPIFHIYRCSPVYLHTEKKWPAFLKNIKNFYLKKEKGFRSYCVDFELRFEINT